jgi:predicted RNA-binding protein with RPS1 domain
MIDGEPLKGVITLTELSNNHKINISEFKYNGKELHVGQELKAKVIGIDDKYGISLSIRQLQSINK